MTSESPRNLQCGSRGEAANDDGGIVIDDGGIAGDEEIKSGGGFCSDTIHKYSKYELRDDRENLWCVKKLEDFRHTVPENGYHEDVAKLADEKPDAAVQFRSCAGPAVAWVRRLTFIALIMNLLLLVVSVKTAECDHTGFARINELLWTILLPVGIVRIINERHVHRYITIPYIQVRGAFGPPGFPIPYWVWIIWMHGITIIQLLDNVCDVFFVSRTYVSELCNHHLMSRLWDEVARNSLLSSIPMNFAVLVLASFFVMLLQFVHSLLEATPRCSEYNNIDYELGDKKPDGSPLTQDFTNMLGGETNCGDALCSLAEGVGFGTLLQVGLLYPRAKEQYLRLQAQSSKGPYSMLKTSEEVEQAVEKRRTTAFTSIMTASQDEMSSWPFNVHKSLQYLENGLSRGLARVGYVALLENAVQINLQITCLALRLAATKHHRTAPTIAEVFSVLTSVVMACLKFNEGLFMLRFSMTVRTEIEFAAEVMVLESPEDITLSSRSCSNYFSVAYDSMPEKTQRLYRSVMLHTWIIRLVMLLLGVFTLYAVAKFVAVFRCPYAVWNISGCVDLGPVLAAVQGAEE